MCFVLFLFKRKKYDAASKIKKGGVTKGDHEVKERISFHGESGSETHSKQQERKGETLKACARQIQSQVKLSKESTR